MFHRRAKQHPAYTASHPQKNRYTGTIIGYSNNNNIYSEPQQMMSRDLYSIRDIQRTQHYYILKGNLPVDSLTKEFSSYLDRKYMYSQRCTKKQLRPFHYDDEKLPVLTTPEKYLANYSTKKFKPTRNQPAKLPPVVIKDVVSEDEEDPPPVVLNRNYPRKESNAWKIPRIIARLGSINPEELVRRAELISLAPVAALLRKPLRHVSGFEDVEVISEDGKTFISASKPPVFGVVDHPDWIGPYFDKSSEDKPQIYKKKNFVLVACHYKRKILLEILRRYFLDKRLKAVKRWRQLAKLVLASRKVNADDVYDVQLPTNCPRESLNKVICK